MRWLVATSLRHAVVILALAVIGTLAAMRGIPEIPLDVFPEFAPPIVEVQTEAPGLSTPEVEALVSVPIESALSGVPGVKTIRSKSVLGLSSVVLIFDEGTASLDNLTEAALLRALEALRGAHTIITVAHRLTTVKSCDRIILLADGEIVDEGSYEDLRNRNVTFREMTG
jgi:hypothetical protein